ncbi:lipopolysaccharide biosynthesis protein [Aestuariibius sp. 2305UL40-4]|uniref:lipopolysaccharide biosynthesis protein n=1 Tax=Aestuariibius violaceus TaxID=3234132 RepID=UPI00345EEAEF
MTRPHPDDIVETDAPTSFGGTVLRGSFHTALSQGVTVVCQIASVLILSRMLEARDFGLIAMIGPIIAFLSMFKEMGLLQAVVQKRDLTYGQLNALFWLNMAVSSVLTLILILAAPLVAQFYGAPDLTPLVQAMALTMLLTGIGAQHYALLNRRMMFGRLAINAGIAAIVSLGTSIAWAFVAPSAWALVAGTVAGAALGAGLVWLWIPWRPGRPAWAAGTGDLVVFGGGLTGFKLTNFLSRNLDNVLIGRYWGGEALGFYDRAYKLLLFPLARVAQPLSQVMVPVLSRLQDEPARYERAFFRVFGLMQLAILPGVAALTAMADTAVPFLLGQQWTAAAPIFAALGVAGLTQPLANPTGWLFISQARTIEMAWWGLASAIVTCLAFAWGVRFGVVELAQAYAAVSVAKLFPLWWLVGRKGPVRRDTIMRRILPIFCAGVVTYVGILIGRHALPETALTRLLIGTALCYVAFAAIFATSRYGRETLGEALDLTLKGAGRLSRRSRKRPA